MAWFKWFTAGRGATGDHAGWQETTPAMPAVENTQLFTPDRALQIPAVWACADLLSRTIATLPCDVFLVGHDGSRTVDTKCNLHSILSVSPNGSMTPFEFLQTMVMHWCLRGNAYALIIRGNDKFSDREVVKSIHPLNPDQMEVYLDDKGKLTYKYYDKRDEYALYKAEQILHWKCMGNGIKGLSKLEYMGATATEALLAQTLSMGIFGRRGRANGILTCEHNLAKPQKEALASQFAQMQSGGIPVLTADLKFQSLSMSPAEQQVLQTRKLLVDEICRCFGVPSALINSDGGAPGSNLEQVTANFYKQTVLPMCISLQQAIIKRLPCIDEKYNHQVEFRLGFLNRSNDSARSSINAQAVQNGWKSRNEVRREEGMPPVADGDILTAQSNLVPLEKLGQTPSADETMNTTEPQRQ